MDPAIDEIESNQLTSGQVREVHSFCVQLGTRLLATDGAARSIWIACARTSVTLAEGNEIIGCKSTNWPLASLSLEDVQGPGIHFELLFCVRTGFVQGPYLFHSCKESQDREKEERDILRRKKKTWTQSCRLFNQCKGRAFIPQFLDNKAQSVSTISFLSTSEGNILRHSELKENK